MKKKYISVVVLLLLFFIIFSNRYFYDITERNVPLKKNDLLKQNKTNEEYSVKEIYKLDPSILSCESMIIWDDNNRVYRKLVDEKTKEQKIYSIDYKYGFKELVASFDSNVWITGFSQHNNYIYYERFEEETVSIYRYNIQNRENTRIGNYSDSNTLGYYMDYSYNQENKYFGVLVYDNDINKKTYDIYEDGNLIRSIDLSKIVNFDCCTLEKIQVSNDAQKIILCLNYFYEQKYKIIKINNTGTVENCKEVDYSQVQEENYSVEGYEGYYGSIIGNNMINIKDDDYIVGDGENIYIVSDLFEDIKIEPIDIVNDYEEKIICEKYSYNPNSNLIAYAKNNSGNNYDIYIGKLDDNKIINSKLIYKNISDTVLSLSFNEEGNKLLVEYMYSENININTTDMNIYDGGLVIELE